TYNITPASGFTLANVFVDGVAQGPVMTYTFSDLAANHAIEASFAPGVSGVVDLGPSRAGIETVRPNPARSLGIDVTFVLGRSPQAPVSLVDLRGRVVLSRPVGALGPGRHALHLSWNRHTPPGLYWVRLVQGDGSRSSRGVVVE